MEQNNLQRAVLVAVSYDSLPPEENSSDETLDELSQLLDTAGGIEVGRLMQNRPSPDPATYIGSGKVREVLSLAQANDADLIIFDSELTPSQKNNLERKLDLPVIDRSGLILDIFARRAQTAEGKLQVELAQYKYLLPRLSGKGIELSRLGGGIGTRGPGESKLETDRRHIRSRIRHLESELEDVRRQRGLSRRQRERREIPVVSIVGYTNAGKSTLANALSGANIPAADRLFETLDTTARKFMLDDTLSAVLTDTVGFIRKLPHHLIRAFRATLEELSQADLILHVIDGSHPEWREFAVTCDRLVDEFCPNSVPRLRVFNKMDKGLTDDVPSPQSGCVHVSAVTGEGLAVLRGKIKEALDNRRHIITVLLPYGGAGFLDDIHSKAAVTSTEYQNDGILVKLSCDDALFGRLRGYIVRPAE